MPAFSTTRNPRHHRNATVAARPSSRSTGAELRALGWLVRHPLFLLAPAAIVAALYWWGLALGGIAVAALPAVALVWWRAHPPSYDRLIAPHVRSGWRRWTAYRGRRWAGLLADCELTRAQHGTGRPLVPRVVRVWAVTPSIDLLRVRMVRGQHPDMFTEHAPALADAFGAHRITVTRARPGVLAMVIERRMPFTSTIPATTIPTSVEEIDLAGLDVGDTETGAPFQLPARGQHWLTVGRTGAGKSSLIYNPLRALAPMIRDGLVRLWVIDLKGGTETDRASALYHRWATTGADAVALLTEFRDSMKARQAQMRAAGMRQAEITRSTPWELLIIDEMAMLTAYGDRHEVRDALRLLAETLTQGRAADHTVWGYVQEPTKDVVDVRDLFTVRVCLAVTAASHVDMALGDGARDRGALADQIPGGPEHAGIGFVIDPLTRAPVRFRAGLVTDRDIDELVTRATPGTRWLTALPDPTDPDQTDDDDDEHDDGEEYAS